MIFRKFIFLILFVASLLGSPAQAKITWDLGVSAGNTAGESYTEGNLGINFFLKEWLIWRNAGFARFPSGELDNIYGLDTSLRAYTFFDFAEESRVTLFGGPGYRFVSEGEHVGFAEAGFNLNTMGLNLGLGVKTFFNKLGDKDASSDTQYFVILSGSGSVGE